MDCMKQLEIMTKAYEGEKASNERLDALVEYYGFEIENQGTEIAKLNSEIDVLRDALEQICKTDTGMYRSIAFNALANANKVWE